MNFTSAMFPSLFLLILLSVSFCNPVTANGSQKSLSGGRAGIHHLPVWSAPHPLRFFMFLPPLQFHASHVSRLHL